MKVKVLCQLGNSFYPSLEIFWDFHQLWSSVTDFSFKDCFLKKLLCGSRRSKICDFCFNRPSPTTIWRRYCFGPTQPPYISKNDQKFFFVSTFWVSGENVTVQVYPENFNAGNFAQFVFDILYMLALCHFILGLQNSLWRSRSPSPVSGGLFENGLKFWRYFHFGGNWDWIVFWKKYANNLPLLLQMQCKSYFNT